MRTAVPRGNNPSGAGFSSSGFFCAESPITREAWPTSSISLSEAGRETRKRMDLVGKNHDAAQRQHRQNVGNFDLA